MRSALRATFGNPLANTLGAAAHDAGVVTTTVFFIGGHTPVASISSLSGLLRRKARSNSRDIDSMLSQNGIHRAKLDAAARLKASATFRRALKSAAVDRVRNWAYRQNATLRQRAPRDTPVHGFCPIPRALPKAPHL